MKLSWFFPYISEYCFVFLLCFIEIFVWYDKNDNKILEAEKQKMQFHPTGQRNRNGCVYLVDGLRGTADFVAIFGSPPTFGIVKF